MRTDPIRQRFEDLVLVLPLKVHRGREVPGRNRSEDDVSFLYSSTEFHVPREAEIEPARHESLHGCWVDGDFDVQHLDSLERVVVSEWIVSSEDKLAYNA